MLSVSITGNDQEEVVIRTLVVVLRSGGEYGCWGVLGTPLLWVAVVLLIPFEILQLVWINDGLSVLPAKFVVTLEIIINEIINQRASARFVRRAGGACAM